MKRQVVTAIIIAVAFGTTFAVFGLIAPHLWNSPDETAVAFFSNNLAYLGHLWRVEPTGIFGPEIVHPRSIIMQGMYLVPASFYGAIYIFGALVKIFGGSAL